MLNTQYLMLSLKNAEKVSREVIAAILIFGRTAMVLCRSRLMCFAMFMFVAVSMGVIVMVAVDRLHLNHHIIAAIKHIAKGTGDREDIYTKHRQQECCKKCFPRYSGHLPHFQMNWILKVVNKLIKSNPYCIIDPV